NLPDHEQPIEGRIVQLAAVADAASETRRVRIEAPNADNLPAGVSVLVWFTVPDAVTAQTARGR
ncbi:MAG: hypothetical protein VYC34_03515, partial [Planctomycetota bacterium]|nr:hypothetical protein [Planctomycetota bacterium]